jgi:cell division protein FtsI/penicillin-binding protein 2
MFITLMFCFMLLIKFLFHVQIIELEKRSLTKIENELKSMKEEARKKEVMTKEEQAKRLKETTKDMVVV